MKLFTKMITITGLAAAMVSCADKSSDFKYLMDEFADLKIMRYQVPGWDELTLAQKEYVYHLAEASKYGRDIIWMQNCKYNLDVRKALEAILENYQGDRTCEEYKAFETYAKRVFFSNGIHHHYAEDKFFPECSQEYFAGLLSAFVSMIGDLSMSVIKRTYGIKDYGKIFPGHGGVLDRFDSILAVSIVLALVLV